MSLRNSARTGRDVYWTRRGMDEFGGGLLGLFLLTLTEKWEKRQQSTQPPSHKLPQNKKSLLGKLFDFLIRV